MTNDTLRTVATYLIAGLVLIGAFILIYQGRGDDGQAWLAIGAVLGFVFRDQGGAAATGMAERLQRNSATTVVSETAQVTGSPVNVEPQGDREG